jgi:hypothetical protein
MGAAPDGGFGSTLFLIFQGIFDSNPAGSIFRFPEDSFDVFPFKDPQVRQAFVAAQGAVS